MAGSQLSGGRSEFCWVPFRGDQLSPMKQRSKVQRMPPRAQAGEQVEPGEQTPASHAAQHRLGETSPGPPHRAEAGAAWLPARAVYGHSSAQHSRRIFKKREGEKSPGRTQTQELSLASWAKQPWGPASCTPNPKATTALGPAHLLPQAHLTAGVTLFWLRSPVLQMKRPDLANKMTRCPV